MGGLFFRWDVENESMRKVLSFHLDPFIDSILNPEMDSDTREEADAQS
jgi:hypothetical protein